MSDDKTPSIPELFAVTVRRAVGAQCLDAPGGNVNLGERLEESL
ncbi:MAG: hypothetical protein SFW67_28525 [Myxococcaceae bacterium]|nr:hypothetical protein [Myxococcaceae bacterium]